MSDAVALLPHDLAVLDALTAVGILAGFAEAPAGALDGVQQRTGPDYVVVYPIGGSDDGSLGEPHSDVDLVYQLTIVGRGPTGVRALQDRATAALAGVTVDGRRVLASYLDAAGHVRPDEDVQPPVFIATPRWRLQTTPTRA